MALVGFCLAIPAHDCPSNGARFPGDDTIGSIEAGKAADLVRVDSNPAADMQDIERVVTVFKDGVGYDPASWSRRPMARWGLR